MTEDVFAGFEEPGQGLDPLAPEHVAPLVGYLASPAARRSTGSSLSCTAGWSRLVERPRVAAKFDTKQDTFHIRRSWDALLSPHYAERPKGETFAAVEVLGLKHG